MAQTDDAGHDARYRRLREEGAPGWASEADYRARQLELQWALAVLEPFTGKRVLELGCGAGNVASLLVARGFEVTGIDISPTAIAWAVERGLPRSRFLVGNLVEGIPGEYELVVDGNLLHCIIGGDRARVLANVRAALVPGGCFFVSTMCGEVTQPALRACFDPLTRCQVVDGVAYRFIGEAPELLLEELAAAGFELLSSRIKPREDEADQDHLLAVVRKR